MIRSDGGGVFRFKDEPLKAFAQRLYETITDQMWAWDELSPTERREWVRLARTRS